jgi:hypothetical protein
MSSRYTERPPESRPEAESGMMDRRAFLRISAAGLAGVALFGSLDSAGALVQKDPPPTSSLLAEFKEAAEKHDVPMALLMAMGYVNTRWEMPPPGANVYAVGDPHGWGSYGIMALVQNPISDTLGEASRLTGIPEEKLKTDRAANIRGGAALLAASRGPSDSAHPNAWYRAVAGRGLAGGIDYAAVSGIGGGQLYAEQVFEVLQTGASGTTFNGESVVLPALGAASEIWGS